MITKPGIGRRLVLAAGVAWLPAVAAAQAPPAADGSTLAAPPQLMVLPTVEVVGTSPLPGIGIDRDKVPANVESLTTGDLSREGQPSLVNALSNQASSVSVNANLGDAFQPDILYRGFEASPVLGTPQGLAVYQNGVRVNEAFGDTVNWDLIPDIAIERLDIVSANPVYGLNALGGAAVVTMKNGFTYQGFEDEASAGSFGARSEAFQYGKRAGDFATYIAGRLYYDKGWRQFSPNRLHQLYADIGARSDRGSLDLSFSGANNFLGGEGTTPEPSLAISRSLDFTTPQNNVNQLQFVTLSGSYRVTDTLSLQANAYRREFHQTVVNGDTTEYTACTSGNGLLCQTDGTTPLTSTAGGPIPDLSSGGTVPIGQNDLETIRTVTWGGTLQTSYTGALFGHENHFVLGGSVDRSHTDFQSAVELGIVDPSLQVLNSGYFVDTPENAGFLATPVSLGADNDYYGIFASDTVNLTSALAVTASGRYNIADIALADHRGANLSGDNQYRRFNPAIGATYKFGPGLTAYAGYSEGNRVPTPSEIECSNPGQPCLLPSSLASDPPGLKQVVSHTYEAGLRGRFTLPERLPGRFGWHFGLYRTDLDEDIYAVATSLSTGYFANIGATRRQGIETGITYKDKKWSVYGSYSMVDATFQTAFTLPSPNNPYAVGGDIRVRPGDRLPGIPLHQLKVGADYRITPHWSIGAALAYFSGQFLRGDESNQNAMLPGYEVVNLHSTYSVTENVQVFFNVQNVLNAKYVTFGQYGNASGVNAPGVLVGGGTNTRFLAPASPLAMVGGIRIRF